MLIIFLIKTTDLKEYNTEVCHHQLKVGIVNHPFLFLDFRDNNMFILDFKVRYLLKVCNYI